jgi:hypothetical protein
LKPTLSETSAGPIWEGANLLPRHRRTSFSLILGALWLVSIVLSVSATEIRAEKRRSNVVCREELSTARRDLVAAKLQKITGWSDLTFDHTGALRIGNREPTGGSKEARELIARAVDGPNVVVLEDASKRSDVVFCRVVPGKWIHRSQANPPVYVVLIDFADFEHVMGDDRALSAFDVGWGLLHELDHIVNDSVDAISRAETGECEAHINQMRRECNLPERADYFYTTLPLVTDTPFVARFVRLSFVEQDSAANKKKQYWVLWDANLVGGLDEQKQIATLR